MCQVNNFVHKGESKSLNIESKQLVNWVIELSQFNRFHLADNSWKHFVKRRNCSWLAIYFSPQNFQHFNSYTFIYSHIYTRIYKDFSLYFPKCFQSCFLQICCIWEGVKHLWAWIPRVLAALIIQQNSLRSDTICLILIVDEDEKWAGQGITEKDTPAPRPPKEPVDEKRKRDSEKRKATRISQQSLDLEGWLILNYLIHIETRPLTFSLM